MRIFVVLFSLALLATGAYGAVVYGSVVDPKHSPVQGAKIVLRYAPTNLTIQESVADAQGQFAFENVPPGLYILEIEAPGFIRYKKGVPVTAKGDVEVPAVELKVGKDTCPPPVDLVYSRSQPGAAEYSGKVIEEGTQAPLFGAKVTLTKLNEQSAISAKGTSVKTDEHGEFVFRGISPGKYVAQITALRHDSLYIYSVLLKPGQSSKLPEPFKLTSCSSKADCSFNMMTVPGSADCE